MRIEIKPFSVNKQYNTCCMRCKTSKYVRRTLTPDYKNFKKQLLSLLPPLNIDFKKQLKVHVVYGFSSKASDIDNPAKSTLDVLSLKYGFNDNQIYDFHELKVITKKGEEFIELTINEI